MWGEGAAAGDGQPPVARLGADLRAARERLGWTLPAIAAHLRIRLPFLEAIEQGRLLDLPGNAYAAGFIRTYAQALGLDPAEVSRRFHQETGEAGRRTELDFPTPVPERGVPVLAVVLVGAIITVGAYIGWYRMSGNVRPAADVVQQVPARLEPLVPDKPAKLASPAVTPSAAPAAQPAAPSALASAQPSPGPAAPATRAAATPSPPPTAISPVSAAAATTQAPAPASTPAVPPTPHLALRAIADAWMQVRDRGGQVLLNRVLRAGETWTVPADKTALLLTTGNAGGTELVVDGVAGPPLGGDGAVRRDVPLEAAAGKLAANASAAPAPARRIVLPHNQ